MIIPFHDPGECWVITDGGAGNRRQAMALAQRLGLPVREIEVGLRPPWSWLAPHPFPAAWLAPSGAVDRFTPPWPKVAIGCGRIAAWYTRRLRRLTANHCHTVQILDPRLDSTLWDTVIAPQHDHVSGANVLHPLGSLNPIDLPWLTEARAAHAKLAALPSPRVGVLLGGPRRQVPMDLPYVESLLAQLRQRQESENGSLLILASRRTPVALTAWLRERMRGVSGLFWGDSQDGRNPYPGVLAWADRLVVSPDSVNMLSEACAVGCAVHTLVVAPLPTKLARFHAALHDSGRLHALDEPAPPYQAPLRETAAIAMQLRRRIAAAPANTG